MQAKPSGGTAEKKAKNSLHYRHRLQTVSVRKALHVLQQIKLGTLTINGKTVTLATRPTKEQKELLQKLGVKPILSFSRGWACSVKTAPSLRVTY